MSAPLQPRPRLDAAGLGSSAFDRHYSRNHCYFLFLRVLRCFSSPRSPRSSCGGTPAGAGFPHSDIAGSMRICRSPTLFAACRVLLRYREPRHPSCALLSFSLFFRLNAPSKGRPRVDFHFGLARFGRHAAPSSAARSPARPPLCCDSCLFVQTSPPHPVREGKRSFSFPVLSMSSAADGAAVVPGRVELPTSTLSV